MCRHQNSPATGIELAARAEILGRPLVLAPALKHRVLNVPDANCSRQQTHYPREMNALLPSSPPDTTMLSSKGDQAVSNLVRRQLTVYSFGHSTYTAAVCPLASGRMSGSLVGKPAGEGNAKGEKTGRTAKACEVQGDTIGHLWSATAIDFY
jgi:hypothetical protein